MAAVALNSGGRRRQITTRVVSGAAEVGAISPGQHRRLVVLADIAGGRLTGRSSWHKRG
jgi:hypothetical protein